MIKAILKNFIKSNWGRFISYIVVKVISVLCPIMLSLNISYIINHTKIYEDMIGKVILTIIILFVFQVSSYFQNYLAIYLSEKFQNQLLLNIYHATIKNANNIVESKINDASYSQKMINESTNIAQYYMVNCIDFIANIISVISSLIALFYVSTFISILLITAMVCYELLILKTNHYIYQRQKKVTKLQAEYFGKTQDAIDALEQIKYYELYQKVTYSLLDIGMRYIKAFLKKLDIQIAQRLILKLFRYIFITLFVINSLSHDDNQGNIIYVITMIEPFFTSCSQILQFIQFKQSIKVSFESLAVLDQATLSILNNSIIHEIHSIQLSHFKADKQKCGPIDFQFKQGNVYCVTGQNGIGKTTLFNVLTGFDSQYSGEIHINHVPIQTLNLNKLYGKQLYLMDQTAEVLEYIDVDSGIISLSRGERQKILIKEIDAHIKNALILLDEPTASLDEKQKIYLLNRIEKLGQKNIVIMITHDKDVLERQFERLELVQ